MTQSDSTVALTASTEEATFFKDRGVTVTSARFILPNQKTYAMGGITSVRAAERVDQNQLALVMFYGGIILAFYVAVLGIPVAAVGGLFSLLGRQKVYLVVLSTSSGEHAALYDPNEEWISRVILALNKAIVHRG